MKAEIRGFERSQPREGSALLGSVNVVPNLTWRRHHPRKKRTAISHIENSYVLAVAFCISIAIRTKCLIHSFIYSFCIMPKSIGDLLYSSERCQRLSIKMLLFSAPFSQLIKIFVSRIATPSFSLAFSNDYHLLRLLSSHGISQEFFFYFLLFMFELVSFLPHRLWGLPFSSMVGNDICYILLQNHVFVDSISLLLTAFNVATIHQILLSTTL